MIHDLIIRLTDKEWLEAQRPSNEELDNTLIRLGSGEIYYQRQDKEVILFINFEQRDHLGKNKNNDTK